MTSGLGMIPGVAMVGLSAESAVETTVCRVSGGDNSLQNQQFVVVLHGHTVHL